MARYSGEGWLLLAGVLVIGISIGVNLARFDEGWVYFWRDGQGGGPRLLKDRLMKDKTERLAFIIVTEEATYQVCSLENTYAYVELRRGQT